MYVSSEDGQPKAEKGETGWAWASILYRDDDGGSLDHGANRGSDQTLSVF